MRPRRELPALVVLGQVGGNGGGRADGRRPRARRAGGDPRSQGHRSPGLAGRDASLVQRAHRRRRGDPSRRPRRRQLRPLRAGPDARTGDFVVASARRHAGRDRPLPVRCRARVVTGDEAAPEGVVAPAAHPQLSLGVGGDHARRDRRHRHHQRRVPGGRHGADDRRGHCGVAARDPRPPRGARGGSASHVNRRGRGRRAPPPTTGSPGR